jgi:hypothetical protein
MSTTRRLPDASSAAGAVPAQRNSAPDHNKGRVRNHGRPRRTVVAAAIVAAAGTGAAIAVFQPWQGGGVVHAPADAIVLPSSVSGLKAASSTIDPLAKPEWQREAVAAGRGAAVTGLSYTSTMSRRSIRLIAGRTDLTGTLDIGKAADAGAINKAASGDVHCTHNLVLVPRTEARVRPTVLLCWRTSASLSVSSLIIDPVVTSPIPDADGVAAVNAAWKAAGGNS